MRNLHKDIKNKYGIEAQQLLQLWEKYTLKECEYKNHRIFTLRCIYKGVILVSVRLKSEGSKLTKRAREIILKAEKQLLWDRVRCINAMLEDSRKAINKCREDLVSRVTNTTDRHKCSSFIEKVSEDRFTKVKERQVRNLNSLVNKTVNINSGISSTGSNHNNGSGSNCQMQGILIIIKQAISTTIAVNGS